VGRTGRADAVGDAFTFVAPDEEPILRSIERVVGKRLPRIVVPDFDYTSKAGAVLEIPLEERIKAIRAKKADDRARAAAKVKRRAEAEAAAAARSNAPRAGAGGAGGSRRRKRSRGGKFGGKSGHPPSGGPRG
jgi:ATP-dependent RNA helicase RhlE